MLETPLTKLLGIEVPILNAPMTPQAGGALARAVSEAGGLGMLGFDEVESVEQIEAQLLILRQGPPISFGVGLVAWVLEKRPELLDLAIAARPALVSVSFGDPAPYVARLHDAGIVVGSQVQSRQWAETALAAGVDLLIAQGTEAGGHTGSVGTLPLLQIVLELTDAPVVAAGGIASGRGLAAVLAAGAAAALVGTPFLLAKEARNTEAARRRIIASDETETILTSVYDRLLGKGWPAEFRGRALRNRYAERWTGHETELMGQVEAVGAFTEARAAGDYDVAHLYAGQSVGLLARERPAADIVGDLAAGAEQLLREW
jgi:nitronate monooxygenase